MLLIFSGQIGVTGTYFSTNDQFPAIIPYIFQKWISLPSFTHYTHKGHKCLIITQPNLPICLPILPMPPKPVAGLRIYILPITCRVENLHNLSLRAPNLMLRMHKKENSPLMSLRRSEATVAISILPLQKLSISLGALRLR
jgi:hypothetical protein